MSNDTRPLGDVANKLLFENELVRVWEMNLAPGERSDRHRLRSTSHPSPSAPSP